MACYQLTVEPAADGQRIDVFIRRFLPDMPPVTLREAFARRDVKLDGKRVKPDARVSAGQQIQIYCMELAVDPLEVVYEDDDVLLVNKRPGISVEPDGGGTSLIELAQRHVRLQDAGAFAPVACHRLDNQTCGIVVLAKNRCSAEILTKSFRDRTMDKRYICLVRGQPKPPEAVCRAWLVKDAEAAHVTVLDHQVTGARPIVTEYETLEAGPISRLRVHLVTGRTHQIRAHMAALGHPLLGDDAYGDRVFNRQQRVRRLMLCAAQITLETGGALPQLDGKTFSVQCPF